VRKLQEEELRRVNKWQKETVGVENSDEELARQLEEALRKVRICSMQAVKVRSAQKCS
jgi:hypothetical protein